MAFRAWLGRIARATYDASSLEIQQTCDLQIPSMIMLRTMLPPPNACMPHFVPSQISNQPSHLLPTDLPLPDIPTKHTPSLRQNTSQKVLTTRHVPTIPAIKTTSTKLPRLLYSLITPPDIAMCSTMTSPSCFPIPTASNRRWKSTECECCTTTIPCRRAYDIRFSCCR